MLGLSVDNQLQMVGSPSDVPIHFNLKLFKPPAEWLSTVYQHF